MKITIDENKNLLYVQKEEADSRMGKESTFYYYLAKLLDKLQFKGESHFFRKNMEKDGHWIGSSNVFYITNKDRSIQVYDADYCMRNVAESFNRGETIDLTVRQIVG